MQVAGRDVQIMLAKNPAGLNQVLRTITANGVDGGHRPLPERRHRRRPRRLLDLGRRLRAAQRQDAVRHGLRRTRLGHGAAPQVRRPLRERDGPRVEPEAALALKQALQSTPEGGTLYVIPTYTAMLEVRDLLAAGPAAAPSGRPNDEAPHAPRRPPLPEADEHLRRPRQHHLPPAPLPAARHRLRGRASWRSATACPEGLRPDLHRRRAGPRTAPRRGRPREGEGQAAR